MSAGRRDLLTGGILLAVLIVVPFVIETRYIVTQLILFFIWAAVVTHWNLVLGVAGVFSLAQMALFACGAYVTAVLGLYLDWSLWAAMPVGALATVVFSIVIAVACLRLRGPYVALLTLAIAQVVYVYIITDTDCFVTTAAGCQQFLGGTSGLRRFGDLGFRQVLGRDWFVAHYFIALALLVVSFGFAAFIAKGPLGLAFKALRDNPGYARARGISRFKYQVAVFAMSSFFVGLAGAFYAAHFRSVGPTVFSFSLLLLLLSMIVVGGIGTLWGPILGAAVLMLADEGLREFAGYRNLGLGLMLAVFVLRLPDGLIGALVRLKDRSRRPEPKAPPPAPAQAP